MTNNQEWICAKCGQAKSRITIYDGILLCAECYNTRVALGKIAK